ncbi:MAG: hypothetical protein F6J92_04630 [Symploca sp. SIO1A3]|nr:hypothetical protein [Symploca sp. SIO1A3]
MRRGRSRRQLKNATRKISKDVSSSRPQKEREKIVLFCSDPIGFAKYLGVEFLTGEQEQIMLSVRSRSVTNVQAAHGVGKTFVSGILVLWWVFAVEGMCVSTAPTGRQVRELLWKEVRTLYDNNQKKLGGRRGKLFVEKSQSAYAYGFSSYDYSSDTFQGIHASRLLVILDEANGISQEIDDGASACVTGADNRLLRIGNPTAASTPFFKACRMSHIRIPVWSHPNVSWAYSKDINGIHRLKAEIAPLIRSLDKIEPIIPTQEWFSFLPRERVKGAVSISWIEKQRYRGEQSAYWVSRVEGVFPEDNSASIIPRSWFIAARARYDDDPEYWDKKADRQEWRWGLDVGDGGDSHGLAGWRGSVLYIVREQVTLGDRSDTARAAGLAINTLKKYPGRVSVDQIGVGAGTLAMLIEEGLEADGVNWGTAAKDPVQFANVKAEDFWKMREAFEQGEVAVAPLGEYEDEVIEDLANIWYEELSTGKIKIEKKDLTRKRLGRSPNLGDAVCYGFNDHKDPLHRISQMIFT